MRRLFAKSIVTLILFFIVLPVLTEVPQENIHERAKLWTGYFNQTRLTYNFGFWVNVHYRMNDNFIDRAFQFLFRPARTYFIKDKSRMNVGYHSKHDQTQTILKGFYTASTKLQYQCKGSRLVNPESIQTMKLRRDAIVS